MATMRVALFTPFDPSTGGGATLFRNLLSHLSGAEFHWFYLSRAESNVANTTRLGPPILGGPLVADLINSTKVFVFQSHPTLLAYARMIKQWSPDVVWVNAMNEGLLMGKLLANPSTARLHVSVHDDPMGLAIKSRRYKHLARVMDSRCRSLLSRADSVDVVSEAMGRRYQHRFGVTADVVFRYIDRPATAVARASAKPLIKVGHVGSAYSAPEVEAFFDALRKLEEIDCVRFKVLAFGRSPAFESAALKFPGLVEPQGDVAEDEAIRQLQDCRFVYSMYSFDSRHQIFRETSQPTKISTYLMAARPMFVHSPRDSTSSQMMERFKLGISVNSLVQSDLIDGLRRILAFDLELIEVQKATEHYCGRNNVCRLMDCLGIGKN
jgi:glycosyltransferase involved in cell wall biosynthesis